MLPVPPPPSPPPPRRRYLCDTPFPFSWSQLLMAMLLANQFMLPFVIVSSGGCQGCATAACLCTAVAVRGSLGLLVISSARVRGLRHCCTSVHCGVRALQSQSGAALAFEHVMGGAPSLACLLLPGLPSTRHSRVVRMACCLASLQAPSLRCALPLAAVCAVKDWALGIVFATVATQARAQACCLLACVTPVCLQLACSQLAGKLSRSFLRPAIVWILAEHLHSWRADALLQAYWALNEVAREMEGELNTLSQQALFVLCCSLMAAGRCLAHFPACRRVLRLGISHSRVSVASCQPGCTPARAAAERHALPLESLHRSACHALASLLQSPPG